MVVEKWKKKGRDPGNDQKKVQHSRETVYNFSNKDRRSHGNLTHKMLSSSSQFFVGQVYVSHSIWLEMIEKELWLTMEKWKMTGGDQKEEDTNRLSPLLMEKLFRILTWPVDGE